ncbi:MAG: Nif3-like dinuclear metal center hexameric protein|nr:Nif3-like dinuclear metal center hexameric protein [Candidatus Buchananbacteria bacterium]
MTVERNKIVKFCEEYLRVNEFEDKCHNGLQVEGKLEINKIITGVSLSQKLIKQAIAKKADMLIVHHGLFSGTWGSSLQITGLYKNRLKLLLENELNLMGFHLPLDAHPEIGNNISLCKILGITQKTEPLDIGFIGELKTEMNLTDFVKLVNEKLQTDSYSIAAGPDKVKKIGVISGGASPDFKAFAQAGCDTFLTGDVRESVVRAVEEIGINFINAGHYNTEKLGVQNLGKVLADKFGVDVEFVDVPCEI